MKKLLQKKEIYFTQTKTEWIYFLQTEMVLSKRAEFQGDHTVWSGDKRVPGR